MKRAFVTGISGQDGSYLAEYLLDLGYQVHGLVRRESHFANLAKIVSHRNLHLHTGDVHDVLSLDVALRKSAPDEIYNLAGQVFVPTSWTQPNQTFKVNTGGLLNILTSTLIACPKAKIYQASSSEMFGNVQGPCNEESKMAPESPYGVSKLASHELCRIYRGRGLYVVSGVLFNHESPRRGLEMVTRKIANAVAKWYHDDFVSLELGNLQARRDWGYAKDYVEGMHLMLQQPEPTDYVLGTGRSYSIRDFISTAIEVAGLDFADVEELIHVKEQFCRPNEVHVLTADASKIRKQLKWEPKTKFHELVKIMVDAEIIRLRQ